MSLCLAYDVHSLQDGAGAQIQRIMAVESLCAYLGLGFHHQEIVTIDSNYGDGLNNQKSKELFVRELNQYIDFRQHTCKHSTHRELNFRLHGQFQRFAIIFLKLLRGLSFITRLNLLIYVSNPSLYLRRSGHIYDLARSRHGYTRTNHTKTLAIKIHLPWAGIGAGQLKDRQISLDWYKELLKVVNFELVGLGYVCRYTFHTDGVPGLKPTMSSMDVSNQTEKYWREMGLLEGDRFNWSFLNLEDHFGFLANVEVRFGITPISVWNDMIEGDILILANSSLSIVGGFLNLSALKFFSPGNQTLPQDFRPITEFDDTSMEGLKSLLLSKFG